MYNVSLALCYLLIVRYKYSNEQMKGIEPYFLYLPITTCFLIFIVGWPFGIYNFDGTYNCYIDAPPVNCDQSDFPNECERGELIFYWNYIGSGIVDRKLSYHHLYGEDVHNCITPRKEEYSTPFHPQEHQSTKGLIQYDEEPRLMVLWSLSLYILATAFGRLKCY